MSSLGTHAGYIVAAYAAAALIVGGLILRAVVDWRAQARALARLEAAGVSRRSSRREAGHD
jgi:heme exporter protein D